MRELIAEQDAVKAQSYRARCQAAAIEKWRSTTAKGGNDAFLRLAHDLNRIGMSLADIDATLWQEAGEGRHPKERRAQIKYIMRSLRGSPQRAGGVTAVSIGWPRATRKWEHPNRQTNGRCVEPLGEVGLVVKTQRLLPRTDGPH